MSLPNSLWPSPFIITKSETQHYLVSFEITSAVKVLSVGRGFELSNKHKVFADVRVSAWMFWFFNHRHVSLSTTLHPGPESIRRFGTSSSSICDVIPCMCYGTAFNEKDSLFFLRLFFNVFFYQVCVCVPSLRGTITIGGRSACTGPRRLDIATFDRKWPLLPQPLQNWFLAGRCGEFFKCPRLPQEGPQKENFWGVRRSILGPLISLGPLALSGGP